MYFKLKLEILERIKNKEKIPLELWKQIMEESLKSKEYFHDYLFLAKLYESYI